MALVLDSTSATLPAELKKKGDYFCILVIVETGFKSIVVQEFIPTAGDKLGSLAKAIDLCDV